ncbi:MAG: MogA/MoaB family molybdenum cofactor biosynthesis protein [Solirubrobacterales bacterium]
MQVAIVTVSSSREASADESGKALIDLLSEYGFEVAARDIVPDEIEAIADVVRGHAAQCDLVLTTGGTGITADDVTPEATRQVIDREVPGIAEAMRAASLEHTPMAMLSRAVAGTCGRALIVNLPGSPQACRECFPVIAPVLRHAHEQLNREL